MKAPATRAKKTPIRLPRPVTDKTDNVVALRSLRRTDKKLAHRKSLCYKACADNPSGGLTVLANSGYSVNQRRIQDPPLYQQSGLRHQRSSERLILPSFADPFNSSLVWYLAF